MTASLAELQTFFATAIQQPVAVPEQPDGLTQTPRFVAGNSRLSPTAQLEIYREQFWLRHVAALQEDFPTLHYLLGCDGFQGLAERYLAAHPPTDFSLRDLGQKLPAFVAVDPAYRDDPLLADCARLEWAFVDAFDAPDAPPLEAASIASIPEDAWPAARLVLHPSVQLVALRHATHEFRAAVRAGEGPARPSEAPTYVVVYRGPDTLQYIDVEPLAFRLLARLAKGEPLGEACEAAAQEDDGVTTEADRTAVLEEQVGGWFQFWAASGWVSAIHV